MVHPRVTSLVWILFMALAGCGGGGGDGGSLPVGMHTVKYEVSTSTQDVSITYIDEDGNTVEVNDANAHDNAWTQTFTAKNGSHLAISARLLGTNNDTVHVTIYVDYKSVAEQLSYSVGVIASAQYDIPLSD